MKQMNLRKSLLVAILTVVLLTSAVSGTIAYLKTSTGTVTNEFQPTTVSTEIIEEKNGTEKSSVTVENTGSIPVYVRVAVVGNWCNDAGNIVEPWSGTVDPGENWIAGPGGYYYYKKVVSANSANNETTNLLNESIVATDRDDGTHLEITVIHQAIQAEGLGSDGKHPVEEMWGVTVNDQDTPNNYLDDTISAPSGNSGN